MPTPLPFVMMGKPAGVGGWSEKAARMLGTQAPKSDSPGFSVFTLPPASIGQISQPLWVCFLI